MISRNSNPLFVFLLMGLFVVGEIGAIAQSKSPQTAEFNAPATAPSAPAITPKPTPIKIGGLTFSGSIRARLESWDWFESGAANTAFNMPKT
jgi:hypothetical protein